MGGTNLLSQLKACNSYKLGDTSIFLMTCEQFLILHDSIFHGKIRRSVFTTTQNSIVYVVHGLGNVKSIG